MRLDDASVSRSHLTLESTRAGWLAVDRVSKNGTRLDGRSVDRVEMPPRGWLEVGGVALLVELEDASAAETAAIDDRVPAEPETDSDSDPLDRAVRELARISGCQRSGLWLVGGRREPRLLAHLGEFDPAPSMTVIGRAATSGQSEYCSDTEGARSLAASESISTGGIRAFFALPVFRGDNVVAVAYADSLAPGRVFTQHDADLLDAVTRQLALILETGRVRRMIRSIRAGL